jgi:hypothetical protein
MRLATAAESSDAISEAQAIKIAADAGYNWPNPSMFLVVASDLSGPPDDGVSVLAWLARWTTLNEGGPVPVTEDGTIPSRPPLTHGYVLIDAHSGEFIKATFAETP